LNSSARLDNEQGSDEVTGCGFEELCFSFTEFGVLTCNCEVKEKMWGNKRGALICRNKKATRIYVA